MARRRRRSRQAGRRAGEVLLLGPATARRVPPMDASSSAPLVSSSRMMVSAWVDVAIWAGTRPMRSQCWSSTDPAFGQVRGARPHVPGVGVLRDHAEHRIALRPDQDRQVLLDGLRPGHGVTDLVVPTRTVVVGSSSRPGSRAAPRRSGRPARRAVRGRSRTPPRRPANRARSPRRRRRVTWSVVAAHWPAPRGAGR